MKILDNDEAKSRQHKRGAVMDAAAKNKMYKDLHDPIDTRIAQELNDMLIPIYNSTFYINHREKFITVSIKDPKTAQARWHKDWPAAEAFMAKHGITAHPTKCSLGYRVHPNKPIAKPKK